MITKDKELELISWFCFYLAKLILKKYVLLIYFFRTDLHTLQAAFPKVANKLINTYDGSTLVADGQQDLIGDRYLAEQIRRINEENKKKSILDKWSHLLYEGEDEKTYQSALDAPITDLSGLNPLVNRSSSPISTRTFKLNGV